MASDIYRVYLFDQTYSGIISVILILGIYTLLMVITNISILIKSFYNLPANMEQENSVKKLNDYKTSKEKFEKKKVSLEDEISKIRITRIAACTISQESVDEDENRLNSMKVDLADYIFTNYNRICPYCNTYLKVDDHNNCIHCGASV